MLLEAKLSPMNLGEQRICNRIAESEEDQDTSAFPGTNPIASVESENHLALELEARCLTAAAVKLGCHPWRAGKCNVGPIGLVYGSIIRGMASLCSMASKNLEMYRTFAS